MKEAKNFEQSKQNPIAQETKQQSLGKRKSRQKTNERSKKLLEDKHNPPQQMTKIPSKKTLEGKKLRTKQ